MTGMDDPTINCSYLRVEFSGYFKYVKVAHMHFFCTIALSSGVARAFPGGRVTHPECQNEEENEKNLRKIKKNYQNLRKQ